MLQKGKVSIVVPIYNVEKYLHRCVESLLQQTYQNIEIILVNDGSPDNCGIIADDYQARESRVKVIHQENGGLSAARNKGMMKVTGEFTMFVDSDDWLDLEMIERMVKKSLAYEADIVQSAFYYAYEDKLLVDKRYQNKGSTPTLLQKRALMYELVTNKVVKNFAWGKLYKTHIIKDIPFTKGVLFEDVFWAHHVMHRVNTYVVLHDPLYYYCQRDDSIVATYSPKNLDIIKGLKVRHHFIKQFYTELTSESYKNILRMNLIHYNLLHLNRDKDQNKFYRREIQEYIKANYFELKQAVKDDPSLRKQLVLFSMHPYLNMAFLSVKKGLRKIGIMTQPTGLEQVNI